MISLIIGFIIVGILGAIYLAVVRWEEKRKKK